MAEKKFKHVNGYRWKSFNERKGQYLEIPFKNLSKIITNIANKTITSKEDNAEDGERILGIIIRKITIFVIFFSSS